MNRRTRITTIIAAALIALCVPALAAAQGTWGRDRDYRNDRRNDDYYGRNGRYDNRTLRDAARRVHNRSRDFQRHLDSALDRSRIDDTRREDNINQLANEFRNAASNFRDRVDDGRAYNRGVSEAQRLLQIGSRLDRVTSRVRLDSRTASDWSQIRQDLRLIADIMNLRFDGGGYYGRGDDRYRRRDDRRNNDEWWRRLPF